MMKSEELRIGNSSDKTLGVKDLLEVEFNKMSKGSTKTISIRDHLCMKNGEKITGYNYLHGSNPAVGDFTITGTATKDANGNIKANLHFSWNDIIDPNLKYKSDAEKVAYAKSKVPSANPEDFIYRIRWDYTVIKKVQDPPSWQLWAERTTWPFKPY